MISANIILPHQNYKKISLYIDNVNNIFYKEFDYNKEFNIIGQLIGLIFKIGLQISQTRINVMTV